MAVVTKNNLTYFSDVSGEHIRVESDRIDAYIEEINNLKLDRVTVIDNAYKNADIDFVRQCKTLVDISIMSDRVKDVTALYDIGNTVERIRIEKLYHDLDMSRFPKIKKFGTNWTTHIKNLSSCANLEILGLLNVNTHDLAFLPPLNALKRFGITRGTITSFKGMELLQNLESTSFDYLSKLEDITALHAVDSSLRELRFESCKRIRYEEVAGLQNLETLAFVRCGDISSLDFLNQMPKLKNFIFVGTNVIDGDLSPCERLDYVGFLDKRHYSHKSAYFEQKNQRLAKQP